jgi:hypothetical protein
VYPTVENLTTRGVEQTAEYDSAVRRIPPSLTSRRDEQRRIWLYNVLSTGWFSIPLSRVKLYLRCVSTGCTLLVATRLWSPFPKLLAVREREKIYREPSWLYQAHHQGAKIGWKCAYWIPGYERCLRILAVLSHAPVTSPTSANLQHAQLSLGVTVTLILVNVAPKKKYLFIKCKCVKYIFALNRLCHKIFASFFIKRINVGSYLIHESKTFRISGLSLLNSHSGLVLLWPPVGNWLFFSSSYK